MLTSAAASGVAALAWGQAPELMIAALIVWGIAVIPDSALFSSMVADAAPPERVGSIMTLQTAIGFLLTAGTVQAVPILAGMLGWPTVMLIMGLGPALGFLAMRALWRL